MHAGVKSYLVSNALIPRGLRALYRVVVRGREARVRQERLLCSLFDWERLIQPYPCYPVEVDTPLYGLSRMLKCYAGLSEHRPYAFYVEHGLFFGSWVQKDEYTTSASHIFTFGDVRERWLREGKVPREVAKIGPMIHYAGPLYQENAREMERLKSELGRTLLFFPYHGDSYTDVHPENFEALISGIRGLARGFDTVLISLYYHDALKPYLVKPYLDAGFRIVTSGHKYDQLFLNRQRFLIELADFTASNGVGTHVGYCLQLGREHRMIDCKMQESYASVQTENLLKRLRTEANDLTHDQEQAEVLEAFLHGDEAAQRGVVAKYWGTDYVRSPEQMRDLIQSTHFV